MTNVLTDTIRTITINGEPWRFLVSADLGESIELPLKLHGWKHCKELGHDFRYAVDFNGTLWRNGMFLADTTSLATTSFRTNLAGIERYAPEALGAVLHDMYDSPQGEVVFRRHSAMNDDSLSNCEDE
jgi:hypothetical protein